MKSTVVNDTATAMECDPVEQIASSDAVAAAYRRLTSDLQLDGENQARVLVDLVRWHRTAMQLSGQEHDVYRLDLPRIESLGLEPMEPMRYVNDEDRIACGMTRPDDLGSEHFVEPFLYATCDLYMRVPETFRKLRRIKSPTDGGRVVDKIERPRHGGEAWEYKQLGLLSSDSVSYICLMPSMLVETTRHCEEYLHVNVKDVIDSFMATNRTLKCSVWKNRDIPITVVRAGTPDFLPRCAVQADIIVLVPTVIWKKLLAAVDSACTSIDAGPIDVTSLKLKPGRNRVIQSVLNVPGTRYTHERPTPLKPYLRAHLRYLSDKEHPDYRRSRTTTGFLWCLITTDEQEAAVCRFQAEVQRTIIDEKALDIEERIVEIAERVRLHEVVPTAPKRALHRCFFVRPYQQHYRPVERDITELVDFKGTTERDDEYIRQGLEPFFWDIMRPKPTEQVRCRVAHICARDVSVVMEPLPFYLGMKPALETVAVSERSAPLLYHTHPWDRSCCVEYMDPHDLFPFWHDRMRDNPRPESLPDHLLWDPKLKRAVRNIFRDNLIYRIYADDRKLWHFVNDTLCEIEDRESGDAK